MNLQKEYEKLKKHPDRLRELRKIKWKRYFEKRWGKGKEGKRNYAKYRKNLTDHKKTATMVV